MASEPPPPAQDMPSTMVKSSSSAPSSSSTSSSTSSKALVPVDAAAAAGTVAVLNPNTPAALRARWRQQAQVLEEDEYSDALNHIIRRDFFPTVHAIESTHERLQSAGLTPTPSRAAAGGYTPRDSSAMLPPSSTSVRLSQGRKSKKDPRTMTLASFLARYTSEDNDSFEQLLEESRVKHKEKYWWLKQQEDEAKKLLTHNHLEPDRPAQPDYWDYKARNLLMYQPLGDDVVQHSTAVVLHGRAGGDSSGGPATSAAGTTVASRVAGPKTVVAANTRFPEPFLDRARDRALQVVEEQARQQAIAAGRDGSTPAVGGFKLMRSPSPMVGGPSQLAGGGGGDSPIVTWGDVVGTPLHLEEEDASSSSKRKSRFRVAATPQRDELGWRLSDKVQKDKKKRRGTSRRTPMNATPMQRLAAMSPAMRRLLGNRTGLRTHGSRRRTGQLDSQLRHSYRTPTPARRSRHAATPLQSSSHKRHKSSAAADSGSSSASWARRATPKHSSSLTDGLL